MLKWITSEAGSAIPVDGQVDLALEVQGQVDLALEVQTQTEQDPLTPGIPILAAVPGTPAPPDLAPGIQVQEEPDPPALVALVVLVQEVQVLTTPVQVAVAQEVLTQGALTPRVLVPAAPAQVITGPVKQVKLIALTILWNPMRQRRLMRQVRNRILPNKP